MSSIPIKTPVLGSFWQKKVLSFFRRVGLQGDGKIRRSDYEAAAERYIELGKLEGVQAKQVRRKATQIWDDFLAPAAPNGEIPVDDALEGFRSRSDKLLETCILIFGVLFDLIDVSGDGVIQKEEYALFLKVVNADEEGVLVQAFGAIDTDGTGQISHDEFIHAGCEYFMSDDDNLPSAYMFGALI